MIAIRRIVIGLTATMLLAVLALGGVTAAWFAGWRLPLASGTTYMQIQKVATADQAGSPSGTFFIALIGTDFRPGVGGHRPDALHLVGVNPTTNTATMLNVPRDTCWRGGKINRATAQDGPRAPPTRSARSPVCPCRMRSPSTSPGSQASSTGWAACRSTSRTP